MSPLGSFGDTGAPQGKGESTGAVWADDDVRICIGQVGV